MITQEQIEKFREIYLKEFGKRITQAEALEFAICLINGVKKVAYLAEKTTITISDNQATLHDITN